MFDIEYAKEVDINFDGGFSYKYLASGSPKITKIWDVNGNQTRVSRFIYRQMCEYARDCLPSWQDIVGERIKEAALNL